MRACASLLLAVVVFGLVGASGATAQSRASAPATAMPPVDVLLAIDGTWSMAASIEQAKRDAERVAAGVQDITSDFRIGVAVFRDYRNPAGEYELLQPLTRDIAAVRSALDRVHAVSNPDPANVDAESYTLMFRKSHSDPGIGWRPEAKKIMTVIGDAEPYGVGGDRLPGCRNDVRDPDGLDTTAELARMKEKQILLLMVRQVTSSTTASLECFQSIAQGAASGSAARDSGRADLAGPILSLVKQSLTPLTLMTTKTSLRLGASARQTLIVTNRISVPVRVAWLRARLPRGLKYAGASATRAPARRLTSGSTLLVWHVNRTVAPGKSVTIGFTAIATKVGRYRATADGLSVLDSGLKVQLAARGPVVKIARQRS
jgi:hypothetical protein